MYLCLGFLFSVLFILYARRENARRDRGVTYEVVGGEPDADGCTKDGKPWFATEDEAVCLAFAFPQCADRSTF